MTRVAIEDAGAQLARLVRESIPGEEIILTQDEQAVAKLIPLVHGTQREPRKGGTARGQILFMADDFDAPLEDFAEYS